MTDKEKLQMRRGFHCIALASLHLVVWFLYASAVGASQGYNPQVLDEFFLQFANRTLQQQRTGVLYNVTLPWRYSGMEVSVVRLRSSTFWIRGMDLSPFHIPPRIILQPYAKRVCIMYQNLQNWSSSYYQVPGYRLVAPIVGFMALDASNQRGVGTQMLEMRVMGNPITVSFPPNLTDQWNSNVVCVKFGYNRTVVLSNMTSPNQCVAQGQGRYSLAIQIPPFLPPTAKEKGEGTWRWWILGLVGGLIAAILAGLCMWAIYKMVMRNKIRGMEKESERCVPFEVTCVGRSRMPSASMIRTQPVLLESDEAFS